MNEGLHFAFTVKTDCPPRQARVLYCAAAACLRDAVGGKAAIAWPGDILMGDEAVAWVGWQMQDGEVLLTFDLEQGDPALPARVEEAVRAYVAGFPENSADIIQAYCNHCRTLMKFVDVVYRGMPVYGFAFAVDKFGGLMVMTQETRTVITVYSGRADLAPDEPQQPEYPLMPTV